MVVPTFKLQHAEFTTAPDNISNDDNSEKAKTLPKQKINQLDFFDDMIMMIV